MKMSEINLSKYGITGTTEIVYNPSYEELFAAEMDPALEGFEKGQLIELGVDRVLTSGLAPDVFYGIDVIREMIEFAEGRIQILPGAGVNLKNIDKIIEFTGCDQIHVARFMSRVDPSTANNRDIFYGGALYPPEDRYDVIDGSYIAQIRTHC